MWSISFLQSLTFTKCAVIVFITFTKDLTYIHRFQLIWFEFFLTGLLHENYYCPQGITTPAVRSVIFGPLSAMAADEQTLIVSATPQTVSELDTPAAVSVVSGEDMRHATPRINLLNPLGACLACKSRTARTMLRICNFPFADSARVQPSAYAGSACTWTAFRQPCPTARADVKHRPQQH